MEDIKKNDNEKLSEIDKKKASIKKLDNDISTLISQKKVANEGIDLVSNAEQKLKRAFASIEEGIKDSKCIQVYEDLKTEELSTLRKELQELENNANSSNKKLDEMYVRLDNEKKELNKLYKEEKNNSETEKEELKNN